MWYRVKGFHEIKMKDTNDTIKLQGGDPVTSKGVSVEYPEHN